MSCSFICNPRQVTKVFLSPVYTSKNPSSSSSSSSSSSLLIMLHCWFLRSYIYTIQHIPEDGIFYLVCRQNRSLTLLLHYNTCRMEYIDHEKWSLYVFSTFSTYHGPTCLLLLLVLLSFFQTATTQPYSKYFCIETPTPLPQKH